MLWRLANQSLLSDLMVELHRESYCDPGLSTLVRVTACRFVIDLLDRSVRMIAALGVFIPAPAAKPKSLFSLEPKPEQAEASAEQEPLPQEESQQLEEALLSEEALQLVALVARIDVKLPRSPFKELALKREIALSHESARSALEGSATGGVDSTPEPEIEENVKQDFKEGIHEILDEAYDEVRDDVLDDDADAILDVDGGADGRDVVAAEARARVGGQRRLDHAARDVEAEVARLVAARAQQVGQQRAIAVAVVSGIVAIGFPVSPWARLSPPGRGAEALVAFAAASSWGGGWQQDDPRRHETPVSDPQCWDVALPEGWIANDQDETVLRAVALAMGHRKLVALADTAEAAGAHLRAAQYLYVASKLGDLGRVSAQIGCDTIYRAVDQLALVPEDQRGEDAVREMEGSVLGAAFMVGTRIDYRLHAIDGFLEL